MHTPLSSKEWAEWLQKQEDLSFEVFYKDPARLIADYRTERDTTRDYEGREILELLQNANDAAADKGTSSRVVIELFDYGLIVGNTGSYFSSDGVLSLRLSHLSPKSRKLKRFIGDKGLGFRAVLNWSHYPIILSGGLSLAYSRTVVRQKLEKMIRQSPELASAVKGEQVSSDDLILPVLAFPGFTPNGDIHSLVDSDTARKVYARCQSLSQKGFDTVIGMPFDRKDGQSRANDEIALLGPEVLLFAPNIGELEIRKEGKTLQRWWRGPETNPVRIYNGPSKEDFQEWKVFRKEGAIPREILKGESGRRLDYEIVLAIPSKEEFAAESLFSFFRTEVRFPYPVVCHVTLELQANRQHPQETDINHFILGELAEYMAETAERLATPESLFAGIRLLAKTSDLDPDLMKVDFESRLINAAKRRRIVPTLKGLLVRPADARRASLSDNSWLPVERFSDVATGSSSHDLRQLLEALELRSLGPEDWRKRLSGLKLSSIQERAALIVGLINENVLPEDPTPELLLDEKGKIIPHDYRIYLPPSDTTRFSIPDWFNLRFLNEQLKEELILRMMAEDQRELQARLTPFHVAEYSLANLVSALVAETNKRVEKDPAQAAHFYQGLLQTLFSLFPVQLAEEARPKFPSDTNVRVLTQNGSYEPARQAYLGKGYADFGELIQGLLGPFAPEKLLAPHKQMGLDGTTEALVQFFKWIGVAALPRRVSEKKVEREFLDYTVRTLPYPVPVGGVLYEKESNFYRPSYDEVYSIDSLNTILKKAAPSVILAWLALDPRAARWKHDAPGFGKLCDRPYRAQYARYYQGPLPSYIRWKIQNTAWLPAGERAREKPGKCLVGERGLEQLYPRPSMQDHPIFQTYRIHQGLLRDAWDHAGVMLGLSHLESDQIYRLLLELPTQDPEGATARTVYRRLLDYVDNYPSSKGPYREEFLKSGKMWGRCGDDEGYYPVCELRHIDSEDIPDPLSRRIKLVALPKRVGSKKVEQLFGVQPVDKNKIIREVITHQPAIGSNMVKSWFIQIKPYLYALRKIKTNQDQDLARFKELEIEICSCLEARISFEEETEKISLQPWDWLLVENTAFILEDPTTDTLEDSALLADTIGAVLASIFRLENGGEFALLIRCPEKDRRKLLQKMLGGDEPADLAELAKEFANLPDVEQAPLVLPNTPAETATPNEKFRGSPAPEKTSLPPSEPAGHSAGKELGPLIVTPQVREPASPTKRTRLRVQAVTKTEPQSYISHRQITDWKFCEKKAMEFELADDPPRFPLLVANITGHEAPGCDILSFASREDRESFKKVKSPRLVVRFIEVKARIDERARIELKGNELDAADKYRERYFLYRFYERSAGEYALAILRNPLNERSALNKIIEVNMEVAKKTESYNLTGGIDKGSHVRWDGFELPNKELLEGGTGS